MNCDRVGHESGQPCRQSATVHKNFQSISMLEGARKTSIVSTWAGSCTRSLDYLSTAWCTRSGMYMLNILHSHGMSSGKPKIPPSNVYLQQSRRLRRIRRASILSFNQARASAISVGLFVVACNRGRLCGCRATLCLLETLLLCHGTNARSAQDSSVRFEIVSVVQRI